MIHLSNLFYEYPGSDFRLDVPQLDVSQGEKVALIGPSGAGKSTLLALMSGALVPNRGSIIVGDIALDELSDSARRLFRATNVGLVFQDFELLEYLTVKENIQLPFLINRQLKFQSPHRDRLLTLVKQTGLADKLHRRPHQLSQGERQRVAICRALVTGPKILLADEPTGSLDPANAANILRLLIDQVEIHAATLVVVTHDHNLLGYLDRTINMSSFLANTKTDSVDSNSHASSTSTSEPE